MTEHFKESTKQKPTQLAEEKIREGKKLHERLSEKQIDKTLADSFPASDPPGWY